MLNAQTDHTIINEKLQEGQHPLTGQCAANFRQDLGAT